MKKHEINFLQTTTIEHLQDQIPSCYGAAVTFGEKVLVLPATAIAGAAAVILSSSRPLAETKKLG